MAHTTIEQLRVQALEDFFQTSPCGYHSIDGAGVFLAINDTELAWLGYTRAEVIGRMCLRDLLTPKSRLTYDANFPRLKEVGRIENLEYELVRKDGRILPVLLNATALYDDDGNFLATRSVLIDRTELARTRNELQDSHDRYTLVVHAADIGIWEWFPEQRRVVLSPRGKGLLGFAPEELPGDEASFFGRLHPDDAVDVPARLRESFAAGIPFRAELRLRHKDGSFRWMLTNGRTEFDSTGCPVRMAGTIGDIHDRVTTEQRLRLSEERFRSAFEFSGIGMTLVSPEGRFLTVNSALCQIVGYSAEELLATDFQSITHPDDLLADLYKVGRLLAGEASSFEMEKRYIHKDGHAVWVLLTVSLVKDENHRPLYFISQIQNISARKSAEEHVRTALREKDTLLQEVHHRVKNNLAVVCELLQLQARRCDEPRLAEILMESRNRVYSMAVVHEMLYQSNSLAGIELPAYVERLARYLLDSQHHVGEPIRLDVACAAVALPLEAAIPFGLLLNELVSNACKHAFPDGRGGQICVQVSHLPPDRLELTVRDNGVGLTAPPEQLRSMGMRLIQALTVQLRGAFDQSTDRGATFRICFPLTAEGSHS